MELRRTVHVVNEQGLHARPCHAVVAMALEYLAELSVCHGEYQVNGKSILSLMTLNAPQGTELLLVALATCMTKGVRRAAAMNHFEVGRVEVKVHGVRQDSPPKMSQIRYEVRVETDEPDHRLDLLHRNIRKFGTVTNTVGPGTDLDGTLVRLVPQG